MYEDIAMCMLEFTGMQSTTILHTANKDKFTSGLFHVGEDVLFTTITTK